MSTAPRLFILLAPLLAVAAGCGKGPSTGPSPTRDDAPTAAPSAAHQIVIDNFTFAPAELTVPVGTEVTWINRDDVPHTATGTVKPRAFDSGALDIDQTYSHVFTAAGEYEYFCAVHPHMTGRVVVK